MALEKRKKRDPSLNITGPSTKRHRANNNSNNNNNNTNTNNKGTNTLLSDEYVEDILNKNATKWLSIIGNRTSDEMREETATKLDECMMIIQFIYLIK